MSKLKNRRYLSVKDSFFAEPKNKMKPITKREKRSIKF